MKKYYFAFAGLLLNLWLFSVVAPPTVFALECNEQNLGVCIDNRVCSKDADQDGNIIYGPGRDCGGSATFGRVQPPKGLSGFNYSATGDVSGIGLVSFISQLIKLATIVAGVWVMFNFLSAGWLYITSEGDAGAHTKVSEKLTFSLIGILVVVAAYTIAGILSLLLFGSATFILNPTLTTIQTIGTP